MKENNEASDQSMELLKTKNNTREILIHPDIMHVFSRRWEAHWLDGQWTGQAESRSA